MILEIEKIIENTANQLFDFCDYPAVKYCLCKKILRLKNHREQIAQLYPLFISSDIVNEMYETQDKYGGWGKLQSKDYTVKAKIPTSAVGINRCLYIGLEYSDREILENAYSYLEEFLTGKSREKLYNKNERAIPWETATICTLIESIKPYNELCDDTFAKWMYIAARAYHTGEYSYESDRAAQHDVFLTREDRLVPMQSDLLHTRRDELPESIENAMLHHLGGHANEHGHFWSECPAKLPKEFVNNKTRRYFMSFNYISAFHGSSIYLADTVDWLIDCRNEDGLWDFGSQIKDPWGYFGYFSLTRNYKINRIVDCTMEILSFLRRYSDNNTDKS